MLLGPVLLMRFPMDAYSSDSDVLFTGAAPALVFGSDEGAIERGRSTIEAAGLRLGARLRLEDAEARLHEQAHASAIWVELGPEVTDLPRGLLDSLNALASRNKCATVISAPAHMVEPLLRKVHEEAELVLDPDDADRASALAIALTRANLRQTIAEAPADRDADRLRQLSDDIGRIAATLARLSAGPESGLKSAVHEVNKDAPHISGEAVRAVIKARRLRSRYFPEELFADPAWDMLLDLLQAEISQLRVPVSSLCIAAAVPATTALRWLKTMVNKGLFIRRDDQHDARRVFVELAPETSAAMRRYFVELGRVAVI
jgi:hypothetical protein